MPDPIHQFEIKRLIELDLFGLDASFTNSSLYMVIAITLISILTIWGMRGRALVPSRIQSVAEISYEFVANMVRDNVGPQGQKFFPFVFTLFMFILFVNMLGMVPTAFTVTSHLAVTAALAMLVFVVVLVVGFIKNGLGFLKLFVPSGVPAWVLPLVVAIEIISFLSRPVSHSVRLFANMLAGHITLKVFRRLYHDAAQCGRCGGDRTAAADHGHRSDSSRIFGGISAGLCVRHADLHVSARRFPSEPLEAGTTDTTSQPDHIHIQATETVSWTQQQQSLSAPASRQSEPVPPPSALATSSVNSCKARFATRPQPTASSAA